jgi:hypothetical protein
MNKTVITFFVLTLFVSAACNRKGCTDIDAANYSSKAKKNDNTCQYTANGMIWFDQLKWLEFNGLGMSTVHFELDGESVGFVQITSYTGTPPSCGSPKGLALTRSLGKSKSKTYTLKVKKANGDLLDTYIYSMAANECTSFKLPD